MEAYRLGVLNPTQLGQELAKLRERRAALAATSLTPRVRPEMPDFEHIRKSIYQFCEVLKERMDTFGFAERQALLQKLIKKVLFTGERVQIRAAVPYAAPSANGFSRNAMCSPSRIAPTGIEQRDRNTRRITDIEDIEIEHCERNLADDGALEFAMNKPIWQLPPPARTAIGQFCA